MLQIILNPFCERVRATHHAPRNPLGVLERCHGLAEIVERGASAVVGEWGEFSFLIAAAARRHHGKGLLRDETYNAICLAVLISMVLAPAGLRFMLKRYESKAKFRIAEAIARPTARRCVYRRCADRSRAANSPACDPPSFALSLSKVVSCGMEPDLWREHLLVSYWPLARCATAIRNFKVLAW